MIYLHRTFRSGVFFVLFFLAFKEMFAQVKIGDQAPAIKITDWVQKNSKDTSLNGKFVIIDFWATWCAPCLASMAHVNELVEEFKQNENLVFLAMSDEPKEKISPLLSRVSFKASVVTDTSGYTQKDYSITSIPDCVIIDDKGQVQWTGNPKNLTKSIIEGILARKKIEMPNVNMRSKDANEIRYDSLTRIYRSIYSDVNFKEYFNLGLFPKVGNSAFSGISAPNKLGRIETGVLLKDFIAKELSVGINQISIPKDLDSIYISYCYKSEKNTRRSNILDSVLSACKVSVTKTNTIQKVLVIEVIDTLLFSTSKVKNQKNNDTRHSSVSDDADFIAIGNSFITDILNPLQNKFGYPVILKQPSFFIGKFDMVLQTENLKALKSSLEVYGLGVNQEMQILPYYNIQYR